MAKAQKTASGADVVLKTDDKVETVTTRRKLTRNKAGVWGKPHTTAPQPTGEKRTRRKGGRWIGEGSYSPSAMPAGEKLATRAKTQSGPDRWKAPEPPPADDDDEA